MDNNIYAIIKNGKGEEEFYVFENEEELRYFLACNENHKLVRIA